MVFLPSERNSVLLVHPNAVLALPVSSQGFETIAWHSGQVIKPLGAVEHRQLPMHHPPEVTRHPASGFAVEFFP
jgi:hypothetical protein